MTSRRPIPWIGPALVVFVALVCLWLTATKLTISPDISALLPSRGEAGAFAQYSRVFGGGEPSFVLVSSATAEQTSAAINEAKNALEGVDGVQSVRQTMGAERTLLPSEVLLLADDDAFTQMKRVLTDEAAMSARLTETRALLLAPGGGAAADVLRRDPLRLGEMLGVSLTTKALIEPRGDGQLCNASATRCALMVEIKDDALRSAGAKKWAARVDSELAVLQQRHRDVVFEWTGPHAIAAEVERLLRSDMAIASVVSLLLSIGAFGVFFRRWRALLAIVPPLLCGTVMASVAALFFERGLSAISIAFVSVVIGVGMDSGVHVYAAVQRAILREDPEPIRTAYKHTLRPVLGSALVASMVFVSLVFSEVDAIRQLGLLAALGEFLTAVCIVIFTPSVALLLEHRAAAPPEFKRWPKWISPVLAIVVVSLALVGLIKGGPGVGEGIIALRPEGMKSLRVYEDLSALFGTSRRAPWVALVQANKEEAVKEKLDRLWARLRRSDAIRGVELGGWGISAQKTRELRHERLTQIDLNGAAELLEKQLNTVGFAVSRFESVAHDLRNPVKWSPELVAFGGGARVRCESQVCYGALSAEPIGGREADVLALNEGDYWWTGAGWVERSLRSQISNDLPKVGGVALVLVLFSLTMAVRGWRGLVLVVISLITIVAGLLGALHLLAVPLHLYDVLVLPVLLGISLDELLFVRGSIEEKRDVSEALKEEGPLVASTALATAGGFGALLLCRFGPLRDVGWVGLLGSVIGLAVALGLVPMWERLHTRKQLEG